MYELFRDWGFQAFISVNCDFPILYLMKTLHQANKNEFIAEMWA